MDHRLNWDLLKLLGYLLEATCLYNKSLQKILALRHPLNSKLCALLEAQMSKK